MRVPPGGPRRDFNGYAYIAYLKTEPDNASIEAHKEKLRGITPAFLKDWNNKYLPEIIENNLKIREFISEAEDEPLIEHLEKTMDVMQRHYYLHFLVIFTLFGATERFSSLYETISGSSDQLKPYELLQGSQNKSLEASEELYNIAKMIKSNQTLSNIFNQANIRPMRRALRDHPMGNEIDQEKLGC